MAAGALAPAVFLYSESRGEFRQRCSPRANSGDGSCSLNCLAGACLAPLRVSYRRLAGEEVISSNDD